MMTLSTIFFQGNMASRSQASKYTTGYVRNPGTDIYCQSTNGSDIFPNLWEYPELDDVCTGWTWNPFKLIQGFVMWMYQSIVYGYTQHQFYSTNITKLNIAGEGDTNQLFDAILVWYKAHPNPDDKLIIAGVSRGAATVFVTMSLLPQSLQERIALVVMEAPFSSLRSVINRTKIFPKFWIWTLKTFTNILFDRLDPIQMVDDYPSHIPTLFVVSEEDTVVPIEETMELFNRLDKRNVGCLRLPHGGHSTMSLRRTERKNNMMYTNMVNTMIERVA